MERRKRRCVRGEGEWEGEWWCLSKVRQRIKGLKGMFWERRECEEARKGVCEAWKVCSNKSRLEDGAR